MFIPPISAGHNYRRRLALFGATMMAAALALAAGAGAVPGSAEARLVPASLQSADTAPAANPPAEVSEIQNRIDSEAGLVVAGEKLHGALLRQFYAAHNYAPVWPSHPAQQQALLGAVMGAGEQGLDPDLFHAALLRNPAALPPLDRELLLSDAFLSYADALARGALPIEQRMDDEDLTPGAVDVPATLDKAIASPDPAAVIAVLAPQSPEYVALRAALRSDRQGGTRLREIEANLERLRWLPRHLPPDRVWVNTADAMLTLYRADRSVFTTRVVVGETDKQSPEFATTIDSVLFDPPWHVPPSIARKEILPRLARDPGYLARHHMVWRAGGGIEQLPPSALGRLKFEMADRFTVYLHDTPDRFLFARSDRRKSHGCVRVQHARELASLLLQEPISMIGQGTARGYTNRRMLPAPIPVFVVYQTALLAPDGVLQFLPDAYDRDQEIWQHLHPTWHAPVAQHELAAKRQG